MSPKVKKTPRLSCIIPVCLAVAALPGVGQAQTQAWESFGLSGRKVYSFDQTGDLLLAGTDGGVYRRNVATGEDWQFLGLATEDVRAIAADPGDSGILLAGIGVGVISSTPDVVTMYKSTNGGVDWAPSDAGIHGFGVHTIAFNAPEAQQIVAAGRRHISVSMDRGGVWNELPGINGPEAFAVAPSARNFFYAAIPLPSFDSLLARSTDGGVPWDALLPSVFFPFISLAVDPLDARVLYSGNLGTFGRSTDGGLSLDLVELPGFPRPHAIVIDPSNRNRLFTGGEDEGIVFFESEDAGITWRTLETPPGAAIIRAMRFDANDASTLYVGTEGTGVYVFDVNYRDSAVAGRHWNAYAGGRGGRVRVKRKNQGNGGIDP